MWLCSKKGSFEDFYYEQSSADDAAAAVLLYLQSETLPHGSLIKWLEIKK